MNRLRFKFRKKKHEPCPAIVAWTFILARLAGFAFESSHQLGLVEHMAFDRFFHLGATGSCR